MPDFVVQYSEILLGLAVISFVLGRYQVTKHKARANWDKVQATIVHRYDQFIRQPRQWNPCVFRKYLLFYRYKVMNREYEGNGYCHFSDNTNDDAEHTAIVNGKFKIGNSIDVYYNPKYPKESVLYTEPGNEGMGWYLAGAVLIFIYLGLLISKFLF